MIPAIWKWLTDNGTALGVIIAAIPILWAGVQFILIKKAENKRVRFTTFHNLIKQLVEPETPDQAMRVPLRKTRALVRRRSSWSR